MIKWVCKKNINKDVHYKIEECIESCQFTNNGKNVVNAKKYIKTMFEIDGEILLTCNGAMGLQALIGGFQIHCNKKLRWLVQAFTFPCSRQGLLIDSLVIDIDEHMGPNRNELYSKLEEYDGIIITNCFGTTTDIQFYETFCKENNKILIFDNAATSFSHYYGKNSLNYGDACFISLHHTKPVGFGEGGFIVFKKEYLESMERSICFGFTKTNVHDYSCYANNSKMSEIACIYSTDYLKNLPDIYNHHTSMIKYFIQQHDKYNLKEKVELLKNYSDYKECLVSCIPLVFKFPVKLTLFTIHNIEAKKYYYPLIECPVSLKLFNHIICLPLNMDIDNKVIDTYIDILCRLNAI
jgi:dTDP-4-amino-4,6-dideoxygalactose transaminase